MNKVTRTDFFNLAGVSWLFIIHVIALTIFAFLLDYYPIKIAGAMVGYDNYHNSTKIMWFDQFTLMDDLNNLHTNQNASTIVVQLTRDCKYDDQIPNLFFFLLTELCVASGLMFLIALMSKKFDKPIGVNIFIFIIFWSLTLLIDIGSIVFGYETINYLAYQQIYAIKGSVHSPISPTYNFSNQYDFIKKLCDLKLCQRYEYCQLKIDEIYTLSNIYLLPILSVRTLALIILIGTNIMAYCQYRRTNWSADEIDYSINESTLLTDKPINELTTLTDTPINESTTLTDN